MLILCTVVIPMLTGYVLFRRYSRKDQYKQVGIRNLIIMLISIVIGGSCFFTSKVIVGSSYKETYKTEEYGLNTLSSNEFIAVNGKEFYVYKSKGSNNEDIYTFYYYDNGNEVEIKNISNVQITINEQENCIPHVEEHFVERKNDIISEKWDNILLLGMAKGKYKEYEIFIPTGTIAEKHKEYAPILVEASSR